MLVTHLHYDHVSNAKLFPNAQFVVSRTGFHLTLDPPVPGLCPTSALPRDVLAYFAGEARDRLILADDEAPEILPGIDAFYIGGHTLCSQAFTVQTRAGTGRLPRRHDLLLRKPGEAAPGRPGREHRPVPPGHGAHRQDRRHPGPAARSGAAAEVPGWDDRDEAGR